MLSQTFAMIAAGFSAAMGGPYHPAMAHSASTPVTDDGGSIVTPGTPAARSCIAQVDDATEAMRAAEGFVDKDVRLLLLGLSGELIVGQRVEVTAGPVIGTFSVQTAERDPAGIGWVARGRPV